MAFNRDRNSRSGGGGFRPRFNDRGPNRGPVEMHKAICDNCRRECEVPFRPTSGKPIFCSNCFENQRGGSDSRYFEGRNSERSGGNVGGKDRFEELNTKLDAILKLLEDKK